MASYYKANNSQYMLCMIWEDVYVRHILAVRPDDTNFTVYNSTYIIFTIIVILVLVLPREDKKRARLKKGDARHRRGFLPIVDMVPFLDCLVDGLQSWLSVYCSTTDTNLQIWCYQTCDAMIEKMNKNKRCQSHPRPAFSVTRSLYRDLRKISSNRKITVLNYTSNLPRLRLRE